MCADLEELMLLQLAAAVDIKPSKGVARLLFRLGLADEVDVEGDKLAKVNSA